MGLALFQLDMRREAGAHLLIAHILLGLGFLVNREVGGTDWSMALVIIHGVRV